jgi:hypothetical protein
VVNVHQGFVAHVERPHQLQGRDLQGEVEGSDQGHRAVRPAQAVGGLAGVVAGDAEAARQETHLRVSEHGVMQGVTSVGQKSGSTRVCVCATPLSGATHPAHTHLVS